MSEELVLGEGRLRHLLQPATNTTTCLQALLGAAYDPSATYRVFSGPGYQAGWLHTGVADKTRTGELHLHRKE